MKTLFEIGTVTKDDGTTMTAVAGNKVVLNVMFGAMALGSTAFLGLMTAKGVQKINSKIAAKELEKEEAAKQNSEATTEEQQ